MFKSLALLAASALLCGCATYVRVPDKNTVPSIAPKAVICVALPSPHVDPEVESSRAAEAAGGGLIPALIDIGVESHRRREALQELSFVRYEADALAVSTLERIVRSDLCLPSGKVPELIFSKGSDASGSRPFATAGKKTVLLLRAHFTFSQDFRTLNLMVEVEGRAASPDSKVFYRNRILASTNSRLGPVIERMDRKLTIEEQAEFRNAFTTVCMEMVKLLAYDLAHSPAEEEQGAFGRIGSGLIIRMDEARIWARGSDGSLTSSERAIPQFQPASAPTAPVRSNFHPSRPPHAPGPMTCKFAIEMPPRIAPTMPKKP